LIRKDVDGLSFHLGIPLDLAPEEYNMHFQDGSRYFLLKTPEGDFAPIFGQSSVQILRHDRKLREIEVLFSGSLIMGYKSLDLSSGYLVTSYSE
jgi:hypothetical protein